MVRKEKNQEKKKPRTATREKQTKVAGRKTVVRASKKIDSELAQVDEKLHKMSDLLADLPQGICFFNKEDVVKYCNDSFASITGYAVETLKGRKLRKNQLWGGRSQKDEFKELFQQARESGERFSAERVSIASSKLGERAWSINLIPQKDGSGEYDGMELIIEDLTEKKPAHEDSLSNALYDAAVLHSEIQPLLDNLAAVLRDYSNCSSVKLFWVNRAHDRSFKADSDNRAGLWDIDRALTPAEIDSLFKNAGSLTEEYHSSGGSIYIRDVGQSEGCLSGILRDIVINSSNSFGFRSMAFIPIRHEGWIEGLIQVADNRGEIKLDALSMIENCRNQLRVILEHAGLKDELRIQREGLIRQMNERHAHLETLNEHLKQEVAERKKAQEEMRVQRDLALALNRIDNLNEALMMCLDTATRVTGMDCGGIYLVNINTEGLELAASKGISTELREKVVSYSKYGINMRLAHPGEPFYLNVGDMDEEIAQSLKQEGIKGIGSIPILFGNELVAVLNVGSHEVGEISYAARNAMEAISAELGVALNRMQNRRALTQSEARYKTLFEMTLNPILVVDEEGRYIDGNDAALAFLECSREELLNMNVSDTLPPYLDNEWYEKYRAIWQTSSTVEREYYVGGKIKVLELTITPMQIEFNKVFIGIGRDLTEKKRIERELKQSEERYRLLVDNSMDVIVTTGMDMQVTYISPSVRYLTGLTAESIIRMAEDKTLTADKLGLAADDADRALAAMRSLFEDPSRTQVLEMEFRHPDGFNNWVEIKMSIMRDKGGQSVGILAVIRDITQQKKMTERLIRSDRLASLGEMAAGLAHEVNNPLTAVMGFSYLVLQNPGIPPDIKRDINSIYNEGKRAADVIKDFLLFARGREPEKQAVFINDIIESTLRLRHSQMTKENIKVLLNLAEDLPAINGDISLLQQVFLNIILNAEHFMYQSNKKGTLSISSLQENGRIKIVIGDDGPGIPPDKVDRIFDPFYTTKQVGEGAGLGLSICHGIIREHGGNIYAESRPGEGASFIIELPVGN